MAPLPELLSPAGSWESLRAAVANGADAVYFGVEVFNARMRAANFRRDELPEIMHWLHQRGVKGFLTVNVLVFAEELGEAAELVMAASTAGVDALIVQDIGLVRLAQALAPSLAIHGSTQMSITSAAGVAQAAALGCERVVLARELTLKDFARLNHQLTARGLSMPLEVFVHGALCVAYSGQCLTSEALGQRSANRGECAQACRLPYQLLVDGEERSMGDQRYLLSPQDLSAWELLPQLAELGIASLKIEGRLKEPSYVAAVTDAYRQGLDRLSSDSVTDGSNLAPSDQPTQSKGAAAHPAAQPVALPESLRRSLELSFSRGLSSGWLEGINHQALVHGRWSKKRGPFVGRLELIDRQGWWHLNTTALLKPGDGVVFEVASSHALEPPEEVGGRVMAVERRGANLALQLGPHRIDGGRLRAGSPCWLTSDPALERQWKRMREAPTPPSLGSLHLRVRGEIGNPLILELVSAGAFQPSAQEEWTFASASPLQVASAQGLDRERLEAQLGRLGGTPWQLDALDLDLPGHAFLPVAQLNHMRRALVDRLAGLEPPPRVPNQPDLRSDQQQLVVSELLHTLAPVLAEPTDQPKSDRLERENEPELVVLVRSLGQLLALRDQPVHRVVADLEQPDQLKQAVALSRGHWPGGIWLAGARVTRPDERWSLEPLLRAEADGYLVRNADQLELLTPLAPCVGDFSLNVANPLSAAWFLDHWGLERITASYDLALGQMLDLIDGCPRGAVEVTVHQHMPLFHMEHCLFCAFLSDGHDHTDCGRPCERHQVLLRDRSGSEHPLRADLGCRNTLFNGQAQTAAEALPTLLRAGVKALRLELLDENPVQTLQRVQHYRAAIAGEISGRQLWQQQKLDSRLGVTRGSLKSRR